MEVRWTPEAIDDLRSLRDFIDARNPIAARTVLERIFKITTYLAELPGLGHPGRVPGTRELSVPGTPYFVVYGVDADVARMLRVLHSARQRPG